MGLIEVDPVKPEPTASLTKKYILFLLLKGLMEQDLLIYNNMAN